MTLAGGSIVAGNNGFVALGTIGDGTPIDLLPWLKSQSGKFIDQPILLGNEERLPCRLIAWRLPEINVCHWSMM